MQQMVSEAGIPTLLTASGTARTGRGVMVGIFVSAASATPTITVWDNTSASGTKVIETFTPVSGQFYAFPLVFTNGCHVAISGTVSCTVLTRPSA